MLVGGRIPHLTIFWDIPIRWRVRCNFLLKLRSAVLSFTLKCSSKGLVFPVTQSSVLSVSCGFSCVLMHACVCSLVSTGSVKPGIVTVIFLLSSSSMACSMAFSFALAIAALFAERTAFSCTNFAKWDWCFLSSSASILSRSLSPNNRSNSASCLATAASAKAFLCTLDEDKWRVDDVIRERERFPDICDTESSLSLKSGSSMEFLSFSCEQDDLAALELLSMSKISHDKFMNRVLGGGAPCDIV